MLIIQATTDLLYSLEEVPRVTRQLNPGVFLVLEHLDEGNHVHYGTDFLPRGTLKIF